MSDNTDIDSIPDETLRSYQQSAENAIKVACALESIWLIVTFFFSIYFTISAIFAVVATSIYACGCCIRPESPDEEKGRTLMKSFYLLVIACSLDFIFIILSFFGFWVAGLIGLFVNFIRYYFMFRIRKGGKAFLITAVRGGGLVVAQPQFQQQQQYVQQQQYQQYAQQQGTMVNNPYANNQQYPTGQAYPVQAQPLSYAQPVIASAVQPGQNQVSPQPTQEGTPVHQQQIYVDPQSTTNAQQPPQQQQQQNINLFSAGIPSYDYAQTNNNNDNNNNNNNNNGPPTYNF